MPYTIPTAADLKTAFPEFAAVSDAVVNEALGEAERMVDTSWTEGDYTTAIMLYACHVMALNGYGTGPDGLANSGQLAAFQTIRSGQLTLTRKASASGGEASWYSMTRYGQRFWRLLRLNKGGVRVAVPTGEGLPSGYAKDWPYAWPFLGYPN